MQRPEPAEDPDFNEAMSEPSWENWRQGQDRVGDILSLPDGVLRKEISIDEYMDSMNEQHEAMLKYTNTHLRTIRGGS